MAEAPRIETARLLLRASTSGDLDAHAAMLGDVEVMRHLTGFALEREDAWRRLLQGPGLWAMLGYGYWSVVRREDGLFLGTVGFADFKRALEPSLEGLPEMGWLFAREAQGQGYAIEAVRAALAWIDEALAPPDVPVIISHDNLRSIRLAEKAGFGEARETLYRAEPILVLRRRRAG
jgi:RimJ/RimL family protein N-acetyltransferase